MDARVEHPPSGDSLCGQGDDEKGYTAMTWSAGPDGRSAVVRPDPVGDPFLCSVDDVVAANLLCHGLDAGDIRSG